MPVRIGLVGCGRLAERGYVPAFEEAEGVELVAVADPVPERCARAAPGLPAFSDGVQLVDAGVAEAIVLATPAGSRLPDARRAAAAGLPVLIEKPPASTVEEAVELASLQPAPRFAFNRRFVPEIARLRELVSAPGRVELALEMSTRAGSWKSYVAREDVLANLGPHLVDLARWLAGAEIGRVRAHLSASKALAQLELENGRGHARVSCSEGPYRERVTAEVGGTRVGNYSTGGSLQALRLLARRSARHPLVPSLARQLEAFGRTVRGASDATLAGPATAWR